MTEARDAYDAEKKRLEKEKIRKRTLWNVFNVEQKSMN
jgi:hypothetical protein